MSRPPLFPTLLMRLLLPRRLHESITGDLTESWHANRRRSRYWTDALLYGVVSYGVNQQMPEFGLRLALGATRSGLVRLVLRRGMVMVAAGIVFGIAGALAASGLLESILYGVKAKDPLTYIASTAALISMGVAACIIPAWRAASADAMAALRSE